MMTDEPQDTERARAVHERMRKAKDAFTKAATAALNGWPLAEVQAAQALEELTAARKELRSLDA